MRHFLPIALYGLLAFGLFNCSDDDSIHDVRHFIHTTTGASLESNNQSDAETRVVTSNDSPKKGQKHRSSDNFSTKNMNEGTHLLWCVPEGISFDIMLDKTAASDPTLASNVTNGALTQFTGNFVNTDRLYIANPSGADGSFQVSYTVVNENADDIYVCVAQNHSTGQSHRASVNFELERGRYLIECPDGITFSVMEDKTAANDNTQASDLKNDMIIDRPQATNIYIADPQDAKGAFVVKFKFTPRVWMDSVSGSKKINEISIPGTHDSSTWLASAGDAKCQNFNFTCQLDQGIRYFDMRVDGDLKLRHGSTKTFDYTLKQALNDMIEWLEENPKEMILIQVKDDADSDYVYPAIEKMLNENPDIDKAIFRENRFPTLSETRGRLVMLRRFPLPSNVSKANWGINVRDVWPDDCTGKGEVDDNKFYIEDRYFSTSEAIHDTREKKDLIIESLDDLNSGNYDDYLFLTFSSIACRAVKTPWDYAWGGIDVDPIMNTALNDILSESKYTKTGVILMDFYNKHGIDDPYKLVDKIIKRNMQ